MKKAKVVQIEFNTGDCSYETVVKRIIERSTRLNKKAIKMAEIGRAGPGDAMRCMARRGTARYGNQRSRGI